MFCNEDIHCECFITAPADLEFKQKCIAHKSASQISSTRDTITNDLELTDFGLQLGCLPSLIQQKLHNHPRSIEMASFMLTADSWDSSCNSREEKYSLLFHAVHTMGKKCTAVRLESIVLAKGLVQQPQSQPPSVSCHSQHLEGNSQLFIESNPLDQTRRAQLAICNEVGSVVHQANGDSFNIVEISDDGERSDGTNISGARGKDSGENYDALSMSLREATLIT